jgi:excisionase family DNA binding protein
MLSTEALGSSSSERTRSIFPGRGAVTKAVLADPVYHVLSDLIFRKEMQERGETAEQLAELYTLTTAEAARSLGVHENTIRQAIATRRIPNWIKKGGRHYLAPSTLYLLGASGVADADPLKVRAGHAAGAKLPVKVPAAAAPGTSTGAQTATIHHWRRVGVLTGAAGKLRFRVLEPGGDVAKIEHEGFYVRGKFRLVFAEPRVSCPPASDKPPCPGRILCASRASATVTAQEIPRATSGWGRRRAS